MRSVYPAVSVLLLGGPLFAAAATGRAERFAGVGRIAQGLDGPTLLDSGFHTALIVYAPDASVMYTCGGDESIPRRLRDGRAMSLSRDGTYLFTGDYGWGRSVVRLTFGPDGVRRAGK
jgi:hypothetical protein